ncbi:MAG: ABC-type sugar transport system ATPase subunit, partial [Akkermansiaceae bacterium]
MAEPFLEVRKVTKRFPGVVALLGVDLQVCPAEVVALIGENGAGKSTLMKILAGVQQADEGELWVDGKLVRFSGVQDAQKAGI